MTTELIHSSSPLAAEIRANWPALSFHYGLSFRELRKMPRWAREEYSKQLPELLASQQLRAIESTTFPWSDDASRSRIMDGLQSLQSGAASTTSPRAAVPAPDESNEGRRGIVGIPKAKSADEMAMLAAASGFGFVKEPGKHSDADFEGQLRKLEGVSTNA